ncbi:hypothetical protein N2152v2_005023 [Parachlorella kessleri]
MLSVEEVLRQHASRQITSLETLDADMRFGWAVSVQVSVTAVLSWWVYIGPACSQTYTLFYVHRRLKAQHIKQRGDEALKAENYREAWERYSEAIMLQPDKPTLRTLHSNRSLAYCKARRFGEALADADVAQALAPEWSKAHWRRGAALLGLRRVGEAALAYRDAWALEKVDKELEGKLWQVVQQLTREQLGGALLGLLRGLEEQGKLQRARLETVSDQELREGFFRLISAAHKGKPKPGAFYERYLNWLKHDLPPSLAYVLRSAAHREAKCYLQARADAQAGVQATLHDMQGSGGTADKPAMALLCEAYWRLGQALLAEKDHPDRDCRGAAKAFAKALDVDPGSEEAKEGLNQAGENLTTEQLDQIAVEVYNEGVLGAGRGLANPSALGFADVPKPGQRVFRVEVSLTFPQAKPSDLGSRAREILRLALAAFTRLDPLRISIERVLAPTASRPGLGVVVGVQVGADLLTAGQLEKAVKDPAQLVAAIGGVELTQLVGPPEPLRCSAEIRDVTPAFALEGAQQAQQQQQQGHSVPSADAEDMQLAVPSRPKMDLELPYRLYRLVRADGSLVERADKHPFCMSRVYYSAEEKPEEVWTELADGSCRWRQTGSEIKIMVLRVPQQLPAKQLEVTLEPLFLKVHEGEVHLEGDLEREATAAPQNLPRAWALAVLGAVRDKKTGEVFLGGDLEREATAAPTTFHSALAFVLPAVRDKKTGEVYPEGDLELRDKKTGEVYPEGDLELRDKKTGEVFLEGDLERAVVPEECFWTQCGGGGEDGCMVYLRKMNLEVLHKHWEHHQMWWPRLFRHHGEIAWDDYEKDYSDLPEEVLQRHRVTEAIKEGEQQLENSERTQREILQEKDDLRKRKRQERLNELRTGTRKDWVQLQRENPAFEG